MCIVALLLVTTLPTAACAGCSFAVACVDNTDCPVGSRCVDSACADTLGSEGEGEGEISEGEGEISEGEGEGEPQPPRLRAGGFTSTGAHVEAGAIVRDAVLLDESFEAHAPLCDGQGRCVTGGFTP